MVVAALKCVAALCMNPTNREQVVDHKLIINHIKSLLSTSSPYLFCPFCW